MSAFDESTSAELEGGLSAAGARSLRGPLRKRESHLWTRDPLDWYVEPEWCSRRLFEVEDFYGGVWDPGCGIGRIVSSAASKGLNAVGSDLVNRAGQFAVYDFLLSKVMWVGISNIVSNPPFRHAKGFVEHALKLAPRKVAMLLTANWVQGQKRARWLASTPLYRIYFICPRPSMPPGAVIQAGGKPGNGTTDYAWFVWLHGFVGAPSVHWCHRDGDEQEEQAQGTICRSARNPGLSNPRSSARGGYDARD